MNPHTENLPFEENPLEQNTWQVGNIKCAFTSNTIIRIITQRDIWVFLQGRITESH